MIMQWELPKVYAVKHKKLDVRMESRSGGIFSALSDEVLNEKGIVYGCVLNEDFEAVHVRAESEEERNQMRGSKYIQSNIGDTYRQAKNDLDADRLVLFSGTSCQISGLKAFLGKEYKNLLCVDIVCHGVPSTLVWKENVSRQERKAYGKCVNANFRNKKDFGWNSSVETYKITTRGREKYINSNEFTKLFYNHYILRPSCYKCPYKSVMHPADITIADYWGIDQAAPGFNDNKGTSLVLINNDVGNCFFEKVKNNVIYKECRLEDSMQAPLRGPFEVPENREMFWKDFYHFSFDRVISRYYERGFEFRIKQLISRIKRKALRK